MYTDDLSKCIFQLEFYVHYMVHWVWPLGVILLTFCPL